MALQPIRSLVLLRWRQRLVSLYVPVLLTATCAGMVMLVVPFEIHRLGGGAAAIGAVGSVWTGAYVISLLFFGRRVDRFDPRHLVRAGLTLIAAVVFLIGHAPNLIVLFLANAGFGLLSGLFWPPIMGWISTGHEGPSLNRRLSLFNVSWSTGMVIGPPLGGLLYDANRVWPFYTAITCLSVAVVVVSVIRSPDPGAAEATVNGNGDVDDVDVRRNAIFRPMARIAHFLTYVTMGMFRYQLPFLAISLGIAAKEFGQVAMALSITMAISFYFLGRSHRWHYRLDVFIVAQVVLALCALALLWVQTWWAMALCLTVGGLCCGVTYSSDLYYGVSGGVKRARRMAIHEMILSMGMVVGSFGSGWVTEHIALRAAYPLCAGLLAAGLVVQLLVFCQRRVSCAAAPRAASSPLALDATASSATGSNVNPSGQAPPVGACERRT